MGWGWEKWAVLSAAWFFQILGSWIFYMIDEVSHLIGKRSVQSSRSVVSDSLLPHESQQPGLWVHHQFPEFTQTHVHGVGDAIQPSHPLSSPSLPVFNPSSIRVFSSESALRMRWPKYWSFSFNISPSNEHSGLISLRMDWLDLLAVQGTLKSILCECTWFLCKYFVKLLEKKIIREMEHLIDHLVYPFHFIGKEIG